MVNNVEIVLKDVFATRMGYATVNLTLQIISLFRSRILLVLMAVQGNMVRGNMAVQGNWVQDQLVDMVVIGNMVRCDMVVQGKMES